jgi:hypothetical protein
LTVIENSPVHFFHPIFYHGGIVPEKLLKRARSAGLLVFFGRLTIEERVPGFKRIERRGRWVKDCFRTTLQ